MHDNYYLVGDEITQINLCPDLMDFKLDVVNVIDFVEALFIEQKSQGKLTHETYPVYLRGTSHWKTKQQH